MIGLGSDKKGKLIHQGLASAGWAKVSVPPRQGTSGYIIIFYPNIIVVIAMVIFITTTITFCSKLLNE